MPESDLQRQQAAMAKGIKEDMLKIAAAQTAIQIGLLFVPVIGWALSAITSVVQFFTARDAKKKLQGVMDNLKANLEKAQAYYQRKLEADKEQVYEGERMETMRRIRANETLDGLGLQGWGSITHAVTRSISHAVHKPVKAIVSAHMKLTSKAAKTLGAKRVAKDIDRSEKQFSKEIDRGDERMADRLTHPYKIGKDLERVGRMAAGTEALHQARIKAREFYATATAEMLRQYNGNHKMLHSPKFRANLRHALKERMDRDPDFRALMEQLPSTVDDPNSATSAIAKTQLGLLAAGAGLLALFKLKH